MPENQEPDLDFFVGGEVLFTYGRLAHKAEILAIEKGEYGGIPTYFVEIDEPYGIGASALYNQNTLAVSCFMATVTCTDPRGEFTIDQCVPEENFGNMFIFRTEQAAKA